MGRWTQYDEDEYRLPAGMKRVGYDADTGRYQYRDAAGHLYEGPEGSQFGELTRVGSAPITTSNEDDDDLEALPVRADGYQPLATDGITRHRYNIESPYRILFPFFLGIGVILLLVWRLVLSPGLSPPKPLCPEDTQSYLVQPGDNCWEIAHSHGCPWPEFQKLNSNINCDRLTPGAVVCLPGADSSI
ncbi:hypothetical protein BDN71DRAFT_1404682 [Pleurotus eryngii]|uniref:LysM domain-containing protein n=1 Tax=Pleurotus eryngii TaxID=5323 RepID=A0A9P6D0D9_PLEER|nr:hypothetical protein BDN71DRAFT_1404682 [Pleurotus eryngii]